MRLARAPLTAVMLGLAVAVRAASLDGLIAKAMASDLQLGALRRTVAVQALQVEQAEGQLYPFLDASLAAFRDPAHSGDLLIDDLNGSTFIDYESNKTYAELLGRWQPFNPSLRLARDLLVQNKTSTEKRLVRQEHRLRQRLLFSLARLWAIQDSRSYLDEQRTMVRLLKGATAIRRELGTARAADRERVGLIENWLQNESQSLDTLLEGEQERLKMVVPDIDLLADLKGLVRSEVFDEALATFDEAMTSMQVEDRSHALMAGKLRASQVAAIARRWNLTLGTRVYRDTSMVWIEADRDLDLKAGLRSEDHHGSGGNLFGFNGIYQEGSLSYLRIDMNLWGGGPGREEAIGEAEVARLVQALQQAEAQGRLDRLKDVMGVKLGKALLETRQKNLEVYKRMAALERRDFRRGQLGLDELLRFELQLAQEASGMRRDRLELLAKVENVMDRADY